MKSSEERKEVAKQILVIFADHDFNVMDAKYVLSEISVQIECCTKVTKPE